MKKILLFTLLASILFLTSCQDPIFEAIREDVPPEEATVSGNITSITRYTAGTKEFLLLAANDGLRYKQKDLNRHGEWKSYKLPFSTHSYDFYSSGHSGEQLLTVLADSTTLYLISAEYTQTDTEGISYPSKIKIWGKVITSNGTELNSDGDWTSIPEPENVPPLFPIEEDSTTSFYKSKFKVFQTNSPIQDHRKVFIRSYDSKNDEYHYYQLNGLSTPAEITIDPASIIDPSPSEDAGYVPLASSAVWFNGEIKFFTSTVATTNETYADEADYYYYSNGNSTLYYSNGSDKGSIDTDHNISALATCSDIILIGYGNMVTGNAGGIDKVILDNKIPTSLGTFTTNAQFQITSDFIVLALLNATPEKSELESSLYSAINFPGTSESFSNVGLWSYYPSRGNWNRE